MHQAANVKNIIFIPYSIFLSSYGKRRKNRADIPRRRKISFLKRDVDEGQVISYNQPEFLQDSGFINLNGIGYSPACEEQRRAIDG